MGVGALRLGARLTPVASKIPDSQDAPKPRCFRMMGVLDRRGRGLCDCLPGPVGHLHPMARRRVDKTPVQ